MFEKGKEEGVVQKTAENIAENIGKEIKDAQTEVVVADPKNIEIHVMPDKFLPQEKKKKMATKKKMIISVIAFVMFLILVLGTMLYIASSSIKKEQVEKSKINIEKEEEIVPGVEEDEEEEIIPEPEPEPEPESEEIIIETNLDEDHDNLTLAEENLYNTDQNKQDTDNDGYTDGSEIKNLYNPLASGQMLLDSGLVSVYTNILYKYNILKPIFWLADSLGEDNSEIIFLNNLETGEFFSLKVIANTEVLDLNTFKALAQETLGGGLVLENYSLGGEPALRTTDGLIAFMVTSDYIYALEYNLGELNILNFATTFEMM